ncbi:MAG: sulfite exporter TauE/SafE family protein [Chitinophagales bacterium]|nr:sulfite exporter TauE/SafE family protein [Chitinophagales bacterium]
MSENILIPAVIFIGSLIYGTFGFGDALFAMPFLSMIIGVKTATPLMTLNGCTLAALLFIKHYKEVDWTHAKKLIFSAFLGIPFGIYFLKNGNETYTKIVLGIIITGIAVYNLFIKKEIKSVKIPRYLVYLFGFIAGVLGGAFNTGGPPIVIFGTLSGWSQLQFIGTLQGFFLPNDLFIISGQLFAGLINQSVVHYYLTGLPFLISALWLGHHLRKKIPEGKFTPIIYILLLVVGVLFLVRSLLLL